MKFNRIVSLMLVVFVLFFVIAPVGAQDTVPAPTAQPISPTQAGELLMAAIVAIVAGGLGSGPLTTFVVGALKHFIPAPDDSGNGGVSAPTLNLLVGGALTIVYWIATHFGLQVQFNSISDFILVSGPALLNLLSTMYSASAIHNVAAAQNVPVFGYKRADTPVLVNPPEIHAA